MRLENRGANGRQTRRPLAPMTEINIIPLVDVTLVLLIIFMVTTAFTRDTALQLELPPAKSSQTSAQNPDEIVIALGRGNQLTLDGKAASESQIAAAMRARVEKNPRARVIIKGDGRVAYQRIVRLMDLARQTGLKSVSLGTRAPEENEAP